MNVGLSSQRDLAHLRHELLTRINHVLGFTEMQIEDARENGLLDRIPALAEINAGGRALLAIIEEELASVSGFSDLTRLEARIASEAGTTLIQARELADQLRASGRQSMSEEIGLVSSALESLLSLAHEMESPPEQVRK